MQIKSHVHYSALLNQFDLTFWVEDLGAIVALNLGSLNWQLYDKDGSIIVDPHATGSGVTPLANGIYNVAMVNNPTFIQNNNSYLVRVEVFVGATPVLYSTFISFIITNL
jgi:hypothetical protein